MPGSYFQYRIADICRLVKGTSPTLKTLPGPYPLVVTAEERRSADAWQLEGPAICVPLISSTGHGDASINRIHFQEGKFALANLLVALLPQDSSIYAPKYLHYYLMSKKNVLFIPLMKGTSNVSLKMKDIANVLVSLPSLGEQRRIVTRIEELASDIEEAQELRRQAMKEAEALAFSSNELYYQSLSARYGLRPLSEVFLTITDGDHNTPTFYTNGVTFIFVGNVSKGYLHFDNSKKVSREYFESLKSSRVPSKGDILYSAVGATLGIPAIVDTDKKFCFQRHVAILKPDKNQLLSDYAWHMMRSRTVFNAAWSAATGSAQPTVPLRAIKKITIPVPPIKIQRSIVLKLDALQGEFNILRAMQGELAAEWNALMPSILDHAFRGGL